MEKYRKLLAKNVRARRVELGLSQEKLAFATDLDRTYISGIERSMRNPSLDVIAKIAVALDTSPSELLTPKKPTRR